MKILKKWFIVLISVIFIMGCASNERVEEKVQDIEVDDEIDDKGSYTIFMYMMGSDLENSEKNASVNIKEMLESEVDIEKTNIILCTSGAQAWWSGLPNDETCIMQIVEDQGKLTLDKVSSLGENVSMGEANTLSEFLQFGYENYKTDHYALICWDQGGGIIRGYGNDEVLEYDSLEYDEIKDAMSNSPFLNSNKFDWVGLDACLAASIEIADLFSDYADYLIASEEVEPSCGWDYSFLSILNETSNTRKIAKCIIDKYKAHVLSNTNLFKRPDITLSCMNLKEMQAVIEAIDNLFDVMNKGLENGQYQQLLKIRSNTKTLQKGSGFDLVDLRHTAQMISDLYEKESDILIKAIEKLVIYQTTNVASTYGVSIYYPYESQEKYIRVKKMQTDGGSKIDLLHSSKEYSSYIENYADIWIDGEPSKDWVTNLLELSAVKNVEGAPMVDELCVKLSDRQMDEFAEAYYTIYCNYGDDGYTPVLMNCKISPDNKGILRVNLNQKLIVGTSGEPGSEDSFWMFKEVEQREDGVLYQSVSTAISGPFGVFATNPTYEPVAINVFVSEDGEVFISSINYAYDTATPDGKQTVNVDHWDTISNVYNRYHPEYENNKLLSYKYWEKAGGIYAREIPLENLQFVQKNINEFNESFVCQVTVVDIYGNEYSTDVEEMYQDEYPIIQNVNTADGKFVWELYEDYAKLKKYTGAVSELKIPGDIQGLPVAAIGPYAFNGNLLQKITLPESVAMLDGYCFANCSSLQTVDLSENISLIPESAFDNCSSLIIIELPENLKQIGRFAFKNCKSLKRIMLPKKVKVISSGVFYGCDYLQKIEVNESNPYYVSLDGVLYSKDMKKLISCPSLFRNSYTIPGGVEEIIDFAFAESYTESISGSKVIGYGLTEIIFPESLKIIGDGAFLGCKRLANIELPEKLEIIGSAAFGDNSLFTSGGNVRVEKTKLNSVKLGDNLSWIGDKAFMSYEVNEFIVSEGNYYFSTNGKQLFDRAGTNEIEIFSED